MNTTTTTCRCPNCGTEIEIDPSWFQQDKFQGNPHIVAQWADLHNAVAQAWVTGDPTHGAYVDGWSKAHPDLVAKWIKDNPATPQPKAPDVVRTQLNIQAELTIICGLAVGYYDPDFPANKLHVGRDAVEKHVVFLDS
jgi:hypothetical protein